MDKSTSWTLGRIVGLVGVLIAGSLLVYHFTFDKNTSLNSEAILDELAKVENDPKFAQFFSDGLASLNRLDSDSDGIPDVNDSDDDDDTIPDTEDNDDDGDGNEDSIDPSTAIVGAIDDDTATAGIEGLTGPSGRDGRDGRDGVDGSNGSDGLSGDDGSAGVDGSNGDEGQAGLDGSSGADGVPGPRGATGATGATGSTGEKGEKGDTGATGTVGVVTDDGVIDTQLTGSDLDIQLLLATNSGLSKTALGLSLDTSCSNNEVLKWNGSGWDCAGDDGGITYTAGSGIAITSGVIASVLGTSIDSSEIADGAIVTADLGDSQITSAKVADDTLNFDVFADALVVDAKTSVTVTDTNELEISRASQGQFLSFTDGTDTHSYMSGAGTPEGTETADTGSLYVDTANAVLYIKSDDGDNTNWEAIGGGLSRLGLITSDPAPAQGDAIYTADASGAGFDITLPAATGSQQRVILLGGDVETNTTTIKVQSGENLNAITDGTKLLNRNGQRIEAIDRAIGQWDIVDFTESSTEPLARVYVPMGADFTNASVNGAFQIIEFGTASYDTNNAWDDANDKYVIPNDGDYSLDAVFSYENNGASSSDTMNIVARVNGSTSALVIRHNISDQISASGALTVTLSGLIPELSAGDEITLEMFDADDIIVTKGNGSSLSIVQQPNSQVVDPGDVPVEDVEVVLDTNTTGLGGVLNLPADLSDYEYVRVEVSDLGYNSAPNPHTFSGRLKVGAIANNRLFVYDEGATALFVDFDSTGTVGTISSSDANWQSATWRAVGIKAQKTVINNNDVAVNDQTASGYFDIGDMRMQWGSRNFNAGQAGGSITVTLPAPMVDTDYSVTAIFDQALSFSSTPGALRVNTKSLLEFDLFIPGQVNSGGSVSWQVMGLKP